MRGIRYFFTRVTCLAWAVICCVALPCDALEAGAAKVEIAPAAGMPLDGDFARRGRTATGTRDPLFVRALFLQDGEAAVFLVSADLFAITPDLRARVLEKAPGAVPRENIVLAATHTLNGPGGLDHSWLGRQRGGRFMAAELDAIAAKFAEAMQTAYDRRTRASAGYAASDTSMVVNRFDPAAKVDGQLSVFRVDDSDGNPIAIVANIGAAPQEAGGLVFSAGFPGAFCVELEGMTATPNTVAMFLNGASGDQVPAATDGTQSFAAALAGRVKGLVNEIKCREVTMAYSSVTGEIPLQSAGKFYSNEAVFQVIEIDRLAMMFMPPIPRGAAGVALRSAAQARGYAQSMVVAPANGYIGAVAPLESIAFASGAEPVYLGPEAEKWLVSSATEALSRGHSAEDTDEKTEFGVKVDERGGVIHLAASGLPAEVGSLRGSALGQFDGAGFAFPALWLETATNGVLGHWQLLRSSVAVESLALPIAGESARGALGSVGTYTIEALAGMSVAAKVPFAHLWLRQLAPSPDPAHPGPIGVAFSLETIDDGVVIGQSLEWPEAVKPVVTQVRPKNGRTYAVAGFPWQVAGVAGVNDRGVAVAVAEYRAATEAAISVPAETILNEVLTIATSFDEAVTFLSMPRADVSGRILVAFDDGKQSQSAIVEMGAAPSVVLDPKVPDFAENHSTPALRDLRVQTLLGGLKTPMIADAERVLTDRDHRATADDHILNARTRACVILAPRSRELCVMAPDTDASRSFEVVSVRGGES